MAPHFTIWLMPPDPARARLAALIQKFSRRYGTPRFQPHITLCSTHELNETEALARTQSLAGRLAPVPVRLTEIGYADEYFRCFFIHAERTETLLAAHRAGCEAFGRAPGADFMPHLSLIYGSLAGAEKERLIEEVGRRVDTSFVAENIVLCAPGGPPQGWRLHGPYPLSAGVTDADS